MKRRGLTAVAISQEDKDLRTAGRFRMHFGEDGPPFELLIDVDGKATPMLHHVSTYYVGEQGIVREIFPGIITTRPSWEAVLARIDELEKQE